MKVVAYLQEVGLLRYVGDKQQQWVALQYVLY